MRQPCEKCGGTDGGVFNGPDPYHHSCVHGVLLKNHCCECNTERLARQAAR